MKTERNIKAVIEYDGTLFKGWQIQPGLRTVQGELRGAFERVLGHTVSLHGSGRTDLGVHATCQVANLRTESEPDLGRLRAGVNSLIGDDVRVRSLEVAQNDFHARYSAVSRTYRYVFGTNERTLSPFFKNYLWYIGGNCDAGLVSDSCRSLIGTKDWRNLSKRDPERRSYTATVFTANIVQWELGFVLEIRANRFLPQMARRIAGTLVAVGRGTTPADILPSLLENPERPAPRVYMAPAHGLYLARVEYAHSMRGIEEEITSGNWRCLHEILH
jgi:tRNA pseudouridine38-40 synthase